MNVDGISWELQSMAVRGFTQGKFEIITKHMLWGTKGSGTTGEHSVSFGPCSISSGGEIQIVSLYSKTP